MRIVTWNCQGRFRDKMSLMAELEPDIAVIQECEPLAKLEKAGNGFPISSQVWCGDSAKGIGVFSFTNYKLATAKSYNPEIRHVIPITVRGDFPFHLLAVWAMNDPNRMHSYVGQAYRGILQYKTLLAGQKCLMIGDFNANTIWDKTKRIANFSDVVAALEKHGMTSVYHSLTAEKYGAESKNTFFLYRNPSKGFHIDYCFAPRKWVDSHTSLVVGEESRWLMESDHLPIIIDVAIA